MKKYLLSVVGMALASVSVAQTLPNNNLILDLAEDTTQVTTIADIVAEQEIVTSRNSNVAHFSKVWSRTSYFNISYNSASLKPDGNIELGYKDFNNNQAPDFKSDWGVGVQLGHNYRLHKIPIAGIVQFNLDYNYIDLNVNHFKAENGNYLYNSAEIYQDGNAQKKNFIPWCLQKYDINYGMTLGPSVTVAPFTSLNILPLHFLKLNLYYHIGYHASLMYIESDGGKDANHNPSAPSPEYEAAQTVNDALKLNLGHGLINSFGFNISWKAIGIGYEVRTGKLKYQSLQTHVFGNKKYNFKPTTSRIYLEIRY